MSRAHRVVAFTPGHREVGGAARRSRLLCEELARRGWEVRAVTRAATAARFRVRVEPGLVVVEVPGCGGRRRGAALFLFVAVVLGVVWGIRATALMSLQLASPSTAASIVSFVVRCPFVMLGSTTGPLSEVPLATGTSVTSRLRRRLLARAAGLVAQTEDGARELAPLAPGAPCHVLPTPVERLDPLAAAGTRRVLFTGRFSAEKDLPTLLAAWRDVVRDVPDARLVLAGAGGDYRSVEHLVRAEIAADGSLAASVVLPGWVADVRPLLAGCDAYVFPSRSEGMSNSLVEACAAGRAVVASAIPANVEVLGADYPLLFPPGDAAALTSQLRSVLIDETIRGSAAARSLDRARLLLLPEVGRRLEEVLLDAADHSRDQLTVRIRRR